MVVCPPRRLAGDSAVSFVRGGGPLSAPSCPRLGLRPRVRHAVLCSAFLLNLQHGSPKSISVRVSPCLHQCGLWVAVPAPLPLSLGRRPALGRKPCALLLQGRHLRKGRSLGVCGPLSLGEVLMQPVCCVTWGSGTGQVPPGRGCLWPARCRRGFITRVQVILERTFIGDSETKEGFRVEEATGEPGCHCALVPLGSYREGISPGGAAVRSLGHQRKGALETGPGGEGCPAPCRLL